MAIPPIPVRFDLYAAVLLAGLVQGYFLTLLFLGKRPHRQPYHHLLLAGLTFTFACIVLEIFLCYSRLMFQALELVDFSEPLNFAIGPLTYLLLRSLSGKIWQPRQWLHFLPFVLYLLYHSLFLLQPEGVKRNAYLGAYFPDAPQVAAQHLLPVDPFGISAHVNLLTLLHVALYIGLAFRLIKEMQRVQGLNSYFRGWLKLLLFFFVASVALLFLLKAYYQNDLGDHLMATFLTLQLFFVSYRLLKSSDFFQPVVQVKYEKSALSEEAKQDLLQKLKAAEESRFYVQPSASLPALAKQLNTSPHYLSQSLNECLGKSFFEYLAELRIQEAKAILSDPHASHLKIEEVAELTGYLSKSAFSAAFKKHTGQTPGQYRKMATV
ncbi:AraC family transcriptional regulator [Pontibacter ummariensis]|uniref:Transcriptional regulator, AraC family n=1 Tax=Pontibacter ummariensis TaxID=1610492 RepID=A0A239FQP6_9BACT|nr:helix-turn-helix transcriptional regulator [Pontibacter ummariensis]PRY11964.1 AraC family transcriptional regulator [Pontibacter ummariensis]SNS59211.1 transcriptional regulator, AraC family [Pontibacter ummariensis]